MIFKAMKPNDITREESSGKEKNSRIIVGAHLQHYRGEDEAWPAKECEKEMLLNRSNMQEKVYPMSQMMTVFYKGRNYQLYQFCLLDPGISILLHCATGNEW